MSVIPNGLSGANAHCTFPPPHVPVPHAQQSDNHCRTLKDDEGRRCRPWIYRWVPTSASSSRMILSANEKVNGHFRDDASSFTEHYRRIQSAKVPGISRSPRSVRDKCNRRGVVRPDRHRSSGSAAGVTPMYHPAAGEHSGAG
jgi:hypothetical protein